MKNLIQLLLILFLITFTIALPVYSQEQIDTSDDWEIRLIPYLWMNSMKSPRLKASTYCCLGRATSVTASGPPGISIIPRSRKRNRMSLLYPSANGQWMMSWLVCLWEAKKWKEALRKRSVGAHHMVICQAQRMDQGLALHLACYHWLA